MKPLFLLADDSDEKRAFLERFIRKMLDVELYTATTTEEAKAVIDEHLEIAAAFIDYQMPTENGPAVIRHLKERNPSIRIALVTHADSREYEKNALDAGAEAFICTSWPLDRVEETINTLLADWSTSIGER